MGLSRRFLNLIVEGGNPAVKSLRRIDLTRQRLFYPDTAPTGVQGATSRAPPPPPRPVTKMGTIRLSGPNLSFQATATDPSHERKMDCFPLAYCSVLCTDQSGRGFLFDPDTSRMGTVPVLHTPKVMPISVFAPNASVDEDIFDDGNGSSLFVMERFLQPEASTEESKQFVALVYRSKSLTCGGEKSWHSQSLSPPPFVREPSNWNNNRRPQITAYGVVGGGSHVCISVNDIGTYCLDTESHVWSKVGDWMLPFHGKVEYVPELKLWFGLSAGTQHLAAADLSDMYSQPKLVGAWKELDAPEEWKECKDSQIVNLDSGRFCIARFFQAATIDADFGDKIVNESFAVLTGVEIKGTGNGNGGKVGNGKGGKVGSGKGGRGKVKLAMTPHKSKLINNSSIKTLFY